MSLAIGLLLFGHAKKAGGYTQQAKNEAITLPAGSRLAAVQAPVILPTEPPPTPKPIYKLKIPSRPTANCVQTLKNAGLLTCKDCSPTDLAKDIPGVKKELKVGEKGIIVTKEGNGTGHTLYAERLPDGTYKSIVEGNHPVGAGRVLSPSVVTRVADQGKTVAPPEPVKTVKKPDIKPASPQI